MDEKLFIENEIDINAPKEKVWNALTNPVETKKYMFGCEVISDLTVGSSMTWQGVLEGVTMVFVIGNVTEVDPGNMLAYSTFDPNSDVPDIPENYLIVKYILTEVEGITNLKVSQGDYSKVADGQARYSHAEDGGGWMGLLISIKELVETGSLSPVEGE